MVYFHELVFKLRSNAIKIEYRFCLKIWHQSPDVVVSTCMKSRILSFAQCNTLHMLAEPRQFVRAFTLHTKGLAFESHSRQT